MFNFIMHIMQPLRDALESINAFQWALLQVYLEDHGVPIAVEFHNTGEVVFRPLELFLSDMKFMELLDD